MIKGPVRICSVVKHASRPRDGALDLALRYKRADIMARGPPANCKPRTTSSYNFLLETRNCMRRVKAAECKSRSGSSKFSTDKAAEFPSSEEKSENGAGLVGRLRFGPLSGQKGGMEGAGRTSRIYLPSLEDDSGMKIIAVQLLSGTLDR